MSRRASTAGSQSSLREANRQLVVETVKRYGGLTQVELAEATGLSQATVSTIVRELYAAGVVDTVATTRSGRRAQMVTLARRVGLAVGVHVGHRSLRVVLGDFTHEVIAEQSLPLPSGHRIRAATAGEHEECWTVVEDAFLEWSERERQPFADWAAQVVERPGFEPWNLRVVVAPDGAVVAVAAVFIAGTDGWVDKLAVRRDRRGEGLAQALLADSFAAAGSNRNSAAPMR